MTRSLECWSAEWALRVWNSDDLDDGRAAIRSLLGPECLLAGLGGDAAPIYGPEAYLPFWEQLRGAFAELECRVADVALDDETETVGRVAFEISAVHGGPFLGKAATGNRIRVRGVTWIRLDESGRAIETRNEWDMEGLLSQIEHPLESVQAAMDAELNSPGSA